MGTAESYSYAMFPQAIGMGETWDPDLIRQVGEIESTEAVTFSKARKYAQGALVIRAPNADLVVTSDGDEMKNPW